MSLVVLHPFFDVIASMIQCSRVLTPTQDETEARISGMTSQSNNLSRIAPRSQPYGNMIGSNSVDTQTPAAFLCPLLNTTQHGYQPPSPQIYNPTLPDSLNDAFMRSLHGNDGEYRIADERNEPTHFGREKEIGGHLGPDLNSSGRFGFPPTFQTENHNHSSQDQSYFDIAELLTPHISGTTKASSTSFPAPLPVAPREKPCSDSTISEGVAAHLAEFSSAVFKTQAEIAGIASAVAEYIAWMRKVPAGSTPPNTTLIYSNSLETIEGRLREMGEMAQTKPRAAFREMVRGIQMLGPAGAPVYSSLDGIEEKFEKQSADVAKFFSTRYNACALMSEQASSIPHGPATRGGSRESPGLE
ncbi:hypothetical protein N7504_005920 [Penicillium tannophilum]|nr:hypothetical protein N7504_005920 [Penicillium tannophilum]